MTLALCTPPLFLSSVLNVPIANAGAINAANIMVLCEILVIHPIRPKVLDWMIADVEPKISLGKQGAQDLNVEPSPDPIC
jgi:hypothetical protein